MGFLGAIQRDFKNMAMGDPSVDISLDPTSEGITPEFRETGGTESAERQLEAITRAIQQLASIQEKQGLKPEVRAQETPTGMRFQGPGGFISQAEAERYATSRGAFMPLQPPEEAAPTSRSESMILAESARREREDTARRMRELAFASPREETPFGDPTEEREPREVDLKWEAEKKRFENVIREGAALEDKAEAAPQPRTREQLEPKIVTPPRDIRFPQIGAGVLGGLPGGGMFAGAGGLARAGLGAVGLGTVAAGAGGAAVGATATVAGYHYFPEFQAFLARREAIRQQYVDAARVAGEIAVLQGRPPGETFGDLGVPEGARPRFREEDVEQRIRDIQREIDENFGFTPGLPSREELERLDRTTELERELERERQNLEEVRRSGQTLADRERHRDQRHRQLRDIRREMDRAAREGGLATPPLDPEATISGVYDFAEGRDVNWDRLVGRERDIDELETFGSLGILGHSLRARGFDTGVPMRMNDRFRRYHRPQTAMERAHSRSGFMARPHVNTPTSEDFEEAGFNQPMLPPPVDDRDPVDVWLEEEEPITGLPEPDQSTQELVIYNLTNYPAMVM